MESARKGDRVLVEGKMRTSSWNDRETGQKRSKTELVALFVRTLGNRRDGARPLETAPIADRVAPTVATDDDVPF